MLLDGSKIWLLEASRSPARKAGVRAAAAALCLGTLHLRRRSWSRATARAAPVLTLDEAPRTANAMDGNRTAEGFSAPKASQLQLKVLLMERGASGRDSDVLVGEASRPDHCAKYHNLKEACCSFSLPVVAQCADGAHAR